ncbi:AcrR family transcriptional regulator [Lipingzhangella halophila]|uniref:AcrR family transcriptional regulator n=1 Tax=Lipingzhangella halophila TaxID=1783352 RepID=A0A7W7W5B7_9ACTN|nr:TetR/AcrR family transcriptional regulator [Lipingzhangella halophila]MBB4934621.1 AcrR family transcriptional regulator [Lipingzhangella halophila]
MDRSTYHHGDLRASLLTSALELIETSGPEHLSLRAVARRAGVSPNAPYNHYADKDALLAALATHSFEQLRERMIAALADAESGDEIVAITVAAVRHALEHPGLHRVAVGTVCSDHLQVRAAEDAVKAVVATSVAVIPGDPEGEALCTGVWALTQGLSLLLMDGSLQPPADEDTDDFIRTVVRTTLTTLNRPG